jgi:hypothetical protein
MAWSDGSVPSIFRHPRLDADDIGVNDRTGTFEGDVFLVPATADLVGLAPILEPGRTSPTVAIFALRRACPPDRCSSRAFVFDVGELPAGARFVEFEIIPRSAQSARASAGSRRSNRWPLSRSVARLGQDLRQPHPGRIAEVTIQVAAVRVDAHRRRAQVFDTHTYQPVVRHEAAPFARTGNRRDSTSAM